jgi:uncharacterized protein DUF4314
MDAHGARLLAARIRAGVRIGSRIEITGPSPFGELRQGDRGTVQAIADTGDIVVAWERGFALEIDPDTTPFQALAA